MRQDISRLEMRHLTPASTKEGQTNSSSAGMPDSAVNEVRHFELLEELKPSGTAKAVLLRWDGNHYIPTNDQIVLFEFVGNHGETGDRGYACFSGESRCWEAMSTYDHTPDWLPL